MKKALALSRDPKVKAPMSPEELKTQHWKEELQLALHLKLLEAKKGLERKGAADATPAGGGGTTKPELDS